MASRFPASPRSPCSRGATWRALRRRLAQGEDTPDAAPTKPFHYWDRGYLATIGRTYAVGSIGPLRLRGFLAWLGWSAVHITYLIGFRNRALVLAQWLWKYLTYQRGARLITNAPGADEPRDQESAPTSASSAR